ncbi:MAG TPA: hypothetical protein VFS39_13710 [Nitrospira sp.]|nr:hypothetical protein [Nitrospira sp.]
MNHHSSSWTIFSVTSCSNIVALIVVLTFFTFAVAPNAWSQDTTSANSSEGGSASSAAMGAAAGLSTLLYLPLKAVFAIGGGIVGGLAYAFSGGNTDAAKSIWTTSMYGTYIITPDHLRGDKPIRFLGVADADEPPAQAPPPAMEPVR